MREEISRREAANLILKYGAQGWLNVRFTNNYQKTQGVYIEAAVEFFNFLKTSNNRVLNAHLSNTGIPVFYKDEVLKLIEAVKL